MACLLRSFRMAWVFCRPSSESSLTRRIPKFSISLPGVLDGFFFYYGLRALNLAYRAASVISADLGRLVLDSAYTLLRLATTPIFLADALALVAKSVVLLASCSRLGVVEEDYNCCFVALDGVLMSLSKMLCFFRMSFKMVYSITFSCFFSSIALLNLSAMRFFRFTSFSFSFRFFFIPMTCFDSSYKDESLPSFFCSRLLFSIILSCRSL